MKIFEDVNDQLMSNATLNNQRFLIIIPKFVEKSANQKTEITV